ncbi:hypothetical protein ACJX0J_022335, partial [Zea mays]
MHEMNKNFNHSILKKLIQSSMMLTNTQEPIWVHQRENNLGLFILGFGEEIITKEKDMGLKQLSMPSIPMGTTKPNLEAFLPLLQRRVERRLLQMTNIEDIAYGEVHSAAFLELLLPWVKQNKWDNLKKCSTYPCLTEAIILMDMFLKEMMLTCHRMKLEICVYFPYDQYTTIEATLQEFTKKQISYKLHNFG